MSTPTAPAKLRQKLLILYAHNPDLNSAVRAWAQYDGSTDTDHTSGDTADPPYATVIAAMRDGWRVIQFPQQFPAYPGMEYRTSYLRYEYVLEQIVEVP